MQTASATTNPTNHNPKPVAGRFITSRFRGKYFRFCTENLILGVFLIPLMTFIQTFLYFPQLLKLRSYIKEYRAKNPHRKPRIVFWTDTLDEVNGIANNIRLTVAHHQKQGRPVHLLGAIHRSRDFGRVENHFVMLLPVFFAMPQLGYPDSELSLPHIKPLLRLAKRYPPDVLEMETPNPGSWVLMLMARIIGVKAISHYRTDGVGYTKLLVKFKPMHYYVHFLIWVFSRATTPVIVPSNDFKKILFKEMGLKDHQVVLLPRGIDLLHFSPEQRTGSYWNQYFTPDTKSGQQRSSVRFITVGRVSVEKALPFLESIWSEFRQHNPEAQLLVVGHGPYLETMKDRMKNFPEVHFTGQLSGAPLYGLYAEADYFVFPSGNDTFGNVIVESMASGTPVLVSDRGGPQDIAQAKQTGWILPFQNQTEWVQAMQECCHLKKNTPDLYHEMRQRCVERSKVYTLDNACQAQWDYFKSLVQL